MLDVARDRAETNTDRLADRVTEGWDIVFVEPSDAVMFQDEYLDLLDGSAVSQVADSAYGVLEYLDTFRLDDALPVEDRSLGAAGAVSYHGHCNQKGTNKDHHAVGVMRRVGYEVDPLDSTCCGMAGSFGYHDEHYDLSKTIGRLLFDKVEESDGDRVVALVGPAARSWVTATASTSSRPILSKLSPSDYQTQRRPHGRRDRNMGCLSGLIPE